MQTPTKKVKRGRKSASESANDYCRLCNCALKIRFGNFDSTSYVSFENIFKCSKTSKITQTLQELCSDLGFLVEKSSVNSDRVCNAHELFHFIKTAFVNGKPSQDEVDKDGEIDDSSESTCRFKRRLPTKKIVKTTERYKTCTRSKKSLVFAKSDTNETSSVSSDNKYSCDEFLSRLNIDELLDKNTTQVKVVIANPNKTVSTHSNFGEETKSLILNIVRKNWLAAANISFKHHEIRRELIGPLRKTVRDEFHSYCGNSSESVLQAKSPVDVASFSNKVLVHEVELACPFWYACLDGACKATQSRERNTKITNSMALISATAARCRNQKMSALAYRISSIIFHSGVKHRDIVRLQKLCLCMSPNSIIEFQKQMGENSEGKVQFWKKEIENNIMAKQLLVEVKEKQVGIKGECDMQLDSAIDFSSEVIKGYENYDKSSFETCTNLMESLNGHGTYTDDDLEMALSKLDSCKRPHYK